MNRAERRRQQKLAKMAASRSPDKRSNTKDQTLSLAMQHYSAGRLSEAESLYKQILLADPNQPAALHLLGVIASQSGKYEIAVDLINKALSIKPDFVDAHYNLGNAFRDQEKLDEAVASYHKAIAIKPDFVEAHINLGLVLQELGKLDEAVANYYKVLAIKPDFAEAHINLGLALQELGKLDEAVASYDKAITIKPDFAEAHINLGLAFHELGKLDEAVASYYKAIAIKPDFAEAHNNLGLALQELGETGDAFQHHRRAITLDPKNNTSWAGLAQSIRTISFTSIDEELCQDLLDLVDQPAVRPSDIVRPVISALGQHPEFSQVLKLTGTINPDSNIPYQQTAARLSSIPLFLRIMELAPINDLKIERMLAFLRRTMLQETMAGKIEETGLPFAAALALQCFTNEYVYPETDEEKLAVERLQRQIAELVEQTLDVPPSLIATLGAYRPLHKFPWAQKLTDRKWGNDISAVIERQISEPFTELSLRSQFARLTSVQDTVSQSVREQYEENPYPRWVKTGLADKGRSIGAVLQSLHFDLGDYQSPESPEILIAGCGTCQHALMVSSRFKDSRVLAVDLSLSSLSYAMRKTNEFSISNIGYAQADIMELNSLDRQFDLIESLGVLHHLENPHTGWQILVDLLKPGGLMNIGLYSETARQSVVEGRSFIAENGYVACPDDIRQCRQDIIRMAEAGNQEMANIISFKDFFSLSECRDLLFHVQEHRFTLPQIKSALKSLELEFLGFEMRDKSTITKFKETYPKKGALTSLSQWHKFELENPDTFRGMYLFWCRKM